MYMYYSLQEDTVLLHEQPFPQLHKLVSHSRNPPSSVACFFTFIITSTLNEQEPVLEEQNNSKIIMAWLYKT